MSSSNGIISVTIGDRRVGGGAPAFLIAEIGYNFSTPEEARQSIAAAKTAGADAVKFQTFRADTIVSRGVDFPPEAGAVSQYDEFKQFEISEALHRELFAYAREIGIICFSTPSYYDDVELLERLDVPAHKVGSDDLTNLPFIDFVARKGRPVVMSTGMGDLEEVRQAVDTFLSTGNSELVLLHCVSNYPVRDPSLLNLRAIRTLADEFRVPVGFSDHSTSLVVPAAAVAMGAVVVERHFALRKDLPVPDAAFSADPEEFCAIVRNVREIEAALGDGRKVPAPSEVAMRRDTRKSVVARTAIPKGATITADMLIVKRPNWGVPPSQASTLIGQKTRSAIKADEPVTWDKV